MYRPKEIIHSLIPMEGNPLAYYSNQFFFFRRSGILKFHHIVKYPDQRFLRIVVIPMHHHVYHGLSERALRYYRFLHSGSPLMALPHRQIKSQKIHARFYCFSRRQFNKVSCNPVNRLRAPEPDKLYLALRYKLRRLLRKRNQSQICQVFPILCNSLAASKEIFACFWLQRVSLLYFPIWYKLRRLLRKRNQSQICQVFPILCNSLAASKEIFACFWLQRVSLLYFLKAILQFFLINLFNICNTRPFFPRRR